MAHYFKMSYFQTNSQQTKIVILEQLYRPTPKLARSCLVSLAATYTHSFYKQSLYKHVSTRQVKKLSNFSTGWKTSQQFEKNYFQYLSGNVNQLHLINRKEMTHASVVQLQYLLM